MGRKKKAAAAAAATEAAQPVVEELDVKKGSFFKKVLFLGLLAGVGFAVFKFRQSSM